jgi:hypothetical protein
MRINQRLSAVARVLLGALILVAVDASAQIISAQQARSVISNDTEMLRLDLRAQRSELVAANMNLTATQAQTFLPIYLDYDSELQNLWNERLKLIAQYATQYETLTDDQADALLVAMLDLDSDLVKLRKKYYREFKDALGAKIAARFMQIDRRLNNLLEIQAQQSIPLVR